MLFSSTELAQFISANFEPAWESVRPVPIVRIDFGNGTVLTRTLNGNIATYLCDTEGRTLDVLPGIYAPDAYRKQLEQFSLLHRYVLQEKPEARAAVLKDYHDRQAAALKENRAPGLLAAVGFISKSRIEKPIKLLASGTSARPFPQLEPAAPKPEDPTKKLTAADEVAGWKELTEDTRLNESVRRLQIHTMLSARGPVPPSEIVKPLYKDVLHADLDDPYLGLGTVLFRDYPFRDEDARK